MENETLTIIESITGSKTIIEIGDSGFSTEVLQYEGLALIHFSLESEYDISIVPILDELILQYSTVKFGRIKMASQPITPAKYAVSHAPTLLIFLNGKVVAQFVGVVPKDTIAAKLDEVLVKPKDELKELTLSELKKAYKQFKGDWNEAVLSGIAAGIAFAIARHNLTGAASLIVPGLALAFFIQNKNFRFSWIQKALAIGLMFMIGTYWKELIELLRQSVN